MKTWEITLVNIQVYLGFSFYFDELETLQAEYSFIDRCSLSFFLNLSSGMRETKKTTRITESAGKARKKRGGLEQSVLFILGLPA